jgi:murein DD-endopeptidase MepM/ murein hydrolase activator NlpD
MSWMSRKFNGLRKELKFSASNPKNFEEVWSFQSTTLRLLSLFVLVFAILGVFLVYLFTSGPFSGYFSKNDVSIERTQLEEQNKEIQRLTEEVNNQEVYLSNLSAILEGKTPRVKSKDSITKTPDINYKELNDGLSKDEKALSDKIKEDLKSNQSSTKSVPTPIFQTPISGEVSEDFDKNNHPGIDIVGHKNLEVLACLSGTVVYSGYTTKDGFIVMIDHGNAYISVYKHNSRVFKQIGDQVRLGDPIAIIGNTGENSTGPHLHFELWHKSKPVDPTIYMTF